MNDIILEKINEVYFRVYCEIGQSLELKSHFSVYVPNYFFSPLFKSRQWNGKISFYDIRTKQFPIGLFPQFLEFCKKFNYSYKLENVELQKEITENEIDIFLKKLFENCYFKNGEPIVPRDYQRQQIINCLQKRKGIIESATSSGKSLVIYSIIRFLLDNNLCKNIILVVPTVSLIEQMFTDFSEYGWKDVEKYVNKLYTNKSVEIDKTLLLTTWQSVYKRPEQFFNRFGGLIIDEVHHLKALSIQQIAKKCNNAKFRLGFSGTIPEEKSDVYNIYGYLGKTISEIKSEELIDKGILSKIIIANLFLKYPEDIIMNNKNMSYIREVDFVNNFEKRNRALDFILNNTPINHNTLILVREINYLKNIETYIQKTFKDKYKIYIIYGEVNADKREQIRQLMEKENNMIIIGSYGTMSTGINIKRLHQIIFFSSYQSKIKILQSVGRGLRLHPEKEKLVIFDVIDDLRYITRNKKEHQNYLFKHFLERLKIYKNQKFTFINKIIKL